MKLKTFVETLLKSEATTDLSLDETLVVLDKLTVAIINLIRGATQIKD
jgi:hypothetical protein